MSSSIALLPWIAIFNSGQGFALAFSMIVISLCLSRRLFFVCLGSSATAAMAYFFWLPYIKTNQIKALNFDPLFFFNLILGGSWNGLAMILILLIALFFIVLSATRTDPRQLIQDAPALLLPGLFALTFALITTLTRANMGLHLSRSSYYVSHTLMSAVSLVLICAWLLNRGYSAWQRRRVYLFVSALIIAATMLSWPQSLWGSQNTASSMWDYQAGLYWRFYHYSHCTRAKAQAMLYGKSSLICGSWESWPNEELKIRYFQGKLPVKNLGAHQLDSQS